MGQTRAIGAPATRRAHFQLIRPDPPTCGSDRWRIDGHPARLLIWSCEEWERMEQRPTDAQYHPFGVWCALRIE